MLQHPEVSLRVKTGQAEAVKRNEITVDDLIAELDEARLISKEDRVGSVMVSATMGKGKLLGLIVDRKDLTVHSQISAMTDAELAQFIDDVDVDDEA